MEKILLQHLSQYNAAILYTPTKDEIDYNNPSFPLKIPKNNLIIPKDRNSDPFEWADKCIDKFKNSKVFILIPGTRFDIYGTRYGKGAGWYDRFLSRVPSSWLRIGVIDISKMSQTKLLRQKWDEPVEWVVVKDGSSNSPSWEVYFRQ